MKFLFVLVLACSHNATFGSYRLNWVSYRGTLFLKNGDSLSGTIWLYQLMNGTVFVRHTFLGYSNHIEDPIQPPEDVKWVRFKDIIRLTIATDTLENKFVVYESLPRTKSLWRVLLKNDMCAIYDDTMIPGWKLGYAPRNMILATRNSSIKLYSHAGWFLHDSKTKALLKRFINKRYRKRFQMKDFPDVNKQLQYISANG